MVESESRVEQVYADEELTIEVVRNLGPYANNSYILRPAGGSAAVVVDVPEGAEAVAAALGDGRVAAVGRPVRLGHQRHADLG